MWCSRSCSTGDFIGVKGHVFKTQVGETSIQDGAEAAGRAAAAARGENP
jgi:hypothetical protein